MSIVWPGIRGKRLDQRKGRGIPLRRRKERHSAPQQSYEGAGVQNMSSPAQDYLRDQLSGILDIPSYYRLQASLDRSVD